MKMFGFWVLSLVVGTAFMFPAFSTTPTTPYTNGVTFPILGDSLTATASTREPKGKSHYPITEKKKSNNANTIDLEDYHKIDPAPNSKANINSGPIEHGTPLMPYIPKPAPPYYPKYHPKHGGSPSPA